MPPWLINLAYLAASALFILGLQGLTHPRTAVRGNLLGAAGMLLAILVTLLDRSLVSYTVLLAGIVVGSAIGAVLAVRIQMTGMPQLVALFNGFGGGASALVAGAALVEAVSPRTQPAEFLRSLAPALGAEVPGAVSTPFLLATAASGLIGAVTFWGSLVAFGKLQELIPGRALLLRGRHALHAALLILLLALGAGLVRNPDATWAYWVLTAVASVLGVLLVLPIGGADMPVVIALLNSYSGLAAAATGFVLHNNMLIIAGSLVGASGLILSSIMCRAMNRSLANVVFGTLGPAAGSARADDVYEGKVKATSAEEVALLLETARRVIFVPGYGLAVAQAQHAVRDLAQALDARGVETGFAIHPVAGRMPGHMNVLLAEADVPYEKLLDLEVVNPTFEQTDVVIVVGANDVVNPLARTDPHSPIAGMPILNVDQARTVVVIKRSLSPGFAGIPNPLFAADNTLLLFGDGKRALLELIAAVKGNR